MHITSPPANDQFLKRDPEFQLKILWKRLKPKAWPISLNDLPDGTALVGGAVRDAFLNRLKEFPDLDLIVPNHAITTAQKLAKKLLGTCIVLDEERDIARLIIKNWNIDFATRNGKDLQEDLLNRDFRVNAIAIRLNPTPRLIDPLGGIKDLRTKQLVAIREQNLLNDPLRLLRGVRLMAEMNLQANEQTKTWIAKHNRYLVKASPERIQTEIQKIVRAPWADSIFPFLIQSNLLSHWQNAQETYCNPPPIRQDAKFLHKTEQDSALPLARLTYLLSDKGLQKLRFSRKNQRRCQRLRYWKNRNDGNGFESLTEVERFKLHEDMAEDLPALILELSNKDQVQWLKRWRDRQDPLFHPTAPINGHELQQSLNLPPGKLIGLLIKHLSREHAFGRLSNRKQTIHSARCWIKQNHNLL